MHGGAAKELFNVLTPRDAFARLDGYLRGPRATERILTASALGRILAEKLCAPRAAADLRAFDDGRLRGTCRRHLRGQ